MHFWLFMEISFVWLSTFTMQVNNPKGFFNKPKHYFILFLFIKYGWIARVLTTSILQEVTEKLYTYSYSAVSFKSPTEISAEVFSKNTRQLKDSESFAFNWHILTPLANK